MNIKMIEFTRDRIQDVIDFEMRLRTEEDFWGWEINQEYIHMVTKSFDDKRFHDSLSLLAYVDDKVVGRIDSTLIASHFDGSIKAYLDWICVIQSYRHCGVAQSLMSELRMQLKKKGANTLVGFIAGNPEAQRFYRFLEGSKIEDEGIWIEL